MARISISFDLLVNEGPNNCRDKIIETEFAKPDQSLDIAVTGKKKAHKTGRDGTRNYMIRPPFAWLFDNIPINYTTRYLELLSKHPSRDPG